MSEITTDKLFRVVQILSLQMMTLNLKQQGHGDLLRLEAQCKESTGTTERRDLENQIQTLEGGLQKLSNEFSVRNREIVGLITEMEGLMPR